jgi:hypothetical protein
MDGDEVVQVYHSAGSAIRSAAKHPVPLKSLVDFERVSVAKGSSATLKFSLPDNSLMLVNDAGDKILSVDLLLPTLHAPSPTLARARSQLVVQAVPCFSFALFVYLARGTVRPLLLICTVLCTQLTVLAHRLTESHRYPGDRSIIFSTGAGPSVTITVTI